MALPVLGTIGRGKSAEDRMQVAEDALIATGLMADAGIKGSMSGTALRAVFSRFSSENRNALFGLRTMGVEVQRNGEMLTPGEIIKSLKKRVDEGIDPHDLLNIAETFAGEKIHADTRRKLDSFIADTTANGGKIGSAGLMKMASMLAGQEAMSGLMAMLSGDWDAKAAAMDKAAGTAQKMADIQLDNLAGDLTILGSAWDAFQQGFFEGSAGDGLRSFVKSLTEVISRAQKLFSDGIGFGDLGKIVFDVIDRLKNKFLELDGIGSLLAGGALIAGLAKVGGMIQRTIGYFRTLKGLEIGQRLGGTAAGTAGGRPPIGLGGGQSVGTMHVSAGVVNVNGNIAGGNGGIGGRRVGDTSIIDRYNRERERIRGTGTPPPPPAPSRLSTMGSAAKGGAAFATVFGLLDLFNVKSASQERSQDAAAQLAAAQKEYQDLIAQGVSQAELGAQTARIAELQAAQTQIAKENAANERQALGGATGAVLGTAIGAGLGSFIGPMGTMLGGIVGGIIGEKLGGAVGSLVGEKLGDEQAAEPVKVSEGLIEQQTASRLGINLQKNEKPQGAFDEITLTSKKEIAPWLTSKDANFFGYNGEDILSPYDGKKYTPPTAWDKMSELKRSYGHGQPQTVVEDELAKFEAETARLQTAAKARSFQGDGRWHGQTYQQQFDAAQAGKAALESTTDFFKAQHQPKATTFNPTPTAGTWQGQSQYFSTQEQARKLNEANAATGDLTASFKSLDDWLFNKAAAAELTPEQQAQQAAMESGLPVAAPTPESITAPETETPLFDFEQILSDVSSFAESVGEMFSGIGDSIMETLSGAFDGVGEIFSGFGETALETLSGALEGIGEIFSGFGETIGDGLYSAIDAVGVGFLEVTQSLADGLVTAFEGAGEIFSGFSELVSSSLATAQGAAESALAAIGAAFDSAKSSIQSAWGELPGFFSGIFDGLGGVAAAAGAAIYSGLTSVIGAVIGAWEGAAATVSGIISRISSMASSAASLIPSFGGGGGGGAFAEGGFVNSPTQALVGEAGAEVIIPLSSSRHGRAMDLFEKTARILGGDALSFGGDELANDIMPATFDDEAPLPTNTATLDADSPVRTSEAQSTGSTEISLGGIQATFNITSDSPQEVLQTIRENLAELADNVAARLSVTVGDVFYNQNLEG